MTISSLMMRTCFSGNFGRHDFTNGLIQWQFICQGTGCWNEFSVTGDEGLTFWLGLDLAVIRTGLNEGKLQAVKVVFCLRPGEILLYECLGLVQKNRVNKGPVACVVKIGHRQGDV